MRVNSFTLAALLGKLASVVHGYEEAPTAVMSNLASPLYAAEDTFAPEPYNIPTTGQTYTGTYQPYTETRGTVTYEQPRT